jgi:hypothetical protein
MVLLRDELDGNMKEEKTDAQVPRLNSMFA